CPGPGGVRRAGGARRRRARGGDLPAVRLRRPPRGAGRRAGPEAGRRLRAGGRGAPQARPAAPRQSRAGPVFAGGRAGRLHAGVASRRGHFCPGPLLREAEQRTGHLLHAEEWALLADHEAVVPVLDHVFGEGNYVCAGAGGDFVIEGVEGYQDLHRDLNAPGSHDRPEPPVVTVNFTVGPLTWENGPMRIIPGTHRLPPGRFSPPPDREENEDWKLLTLSPLPAGCAIVRDNRTWHAGTPNLSARPRFLPNLEYAARWWCRGATSEHWRCEWLLAPRRLVAGSRLRRARRASAVRAAPAAQEARLGGRCRAEASFGVNGQPCDPSVPGGTAMQGCDYVDVSLVDGWTLPFKLQIDGGECKATSDGVDTKVESIDCSELLFEDCPKSEDLSAAGFTADLRAINPRTGKMAGCYSPCMLLQDEKWNNSRPHDFVSSDEHVAPYCCPTPPETPEACRAGPITGTRFIQTVHKKCPGVY
ncbi:unnamed protein product, partial [Prorocentrum cordatum]